MTRIAEATGDTVFLTQRSGLDDLYPLLAREVVSLGVLPRRVGRAMQHPLDLAKLHFFDGEGRKLDG